MYNILSTDQAILIGRIIGGLFLLFGVVGLFYILFSATKSKPKKVKEKKVKKNRKSEAESIVPAGDFSFSKIQTFEGEKPKEKKSRFSKTARPPKKEKVATKKDIPSQTTQPPQTPPDFNDFTPGGDFSSSSFDKVEENSFPPVSLPESHIPLSPQPLQNPPAPRPIAPGAGAPIPARPGSGIPSRPAASPMPLPSLEDSDGFIPRRLRREQASGDENF